MKTLYSMLFVVCLFLAKIHAQTPQISYELTTNESGATKNYVARDNITLKPGFDFKAEAGYTFNAKIDAGLLFPPTDGTYKYSNGQIGSSSSLPQIGQGITVGTISGQAGVSPTGAATYTMPIECPPGINGMQPGLSIVYNSQAGSGLLGRGWDLAGLSSITRGNRSMHFDGMNDNININNDDALYLDGQRLIYIGGGTGSFTSGATYATEVENYSRIVYQDNKFTLTTADGKVLEYGNQYSNALLFNSKETVPLDTRIFSWKLDNITDQYGNEMSFEYTFGGNYIDKITYTLDSKSYSSEDEIDFNYIDNTNAKSIYVNSFLLLNDKILKSIDVKENFKTLKTYTFNYNSEQNLSDIITQTGSKELLGSLHVNWGKSSNQIIFQNLGSNRYPNLTTVKGSVYSGDVNGDGYPDRIELYPGESTGSDYEKGFINVCLFDKNTGTFSPTSTSITFSFTDDAYLPRSGNNYDKIIISDINNDGKNEITLYNEEYLYCFYFSNGSLNNLGKRIYASYADKSSDTYVSLIDNRSSKVFCANVNHDQYNDIIITYNTRKDMDNENNIIGYCVFPGSANGLTTPEYKVIRDDFFKDYMIGDFNADGKPDMFGVLDNNDVYDIINDKVSVYADGKWKYASNSRKLYSSDFNGDGLSDILVQDNDNSWHMLYNNGVGQDPTNISLGQFARACDASGNGELDDAIPIDYNGDGQMDIVIGDETFDDYGFQYTTWYFYKNTHGSFTLDKEFKTYNRMAYYIADVNNDGVDDLIVSECEYKQSSDGQYYYDFYYKACIFKDYNKDQLVNTITNNMGQEVGFRFKHLSNYEAWNSTTDTGNILPLRVPMLLIDSIIDISGNAEHFEYINPKYTPLGKGFLGFSSITVTNAQKNLKIENNYEFNSDYYFPALIFQRTSSLKYDGDIRAYAPYNAVKVIDSARKRFIPYLINDATLDEQTGIVTYNSLDYSQYPDKISSTSSVGDISTHTVTQYTGPEGHSKYLPLSVSVTQKNGNDSITRTKAYSYQFDGTNPYKITAYTETIDQGDQNAVTTRYTNYDRWGHPQNIAITANGNTRTSSVSYSGTNSTGRYVQSKTNALNQTTTYKWNETSGTLLSETDPYGHTTTYSYNVRNQLTNTSYPDGTRKTIVMQWAVDNSFGALYYSYTQSSGKAPQLIWYDKLGREVKRDNYGLNNKKISVTTEYYTSGPNKDRLYRVSAPFFEENEATKTWDKTYSQYDDYGRSTEVQTPMGNITSVYDLCTTTVTTPEGTTVSQLNRSGQLESKTINGKMVSYTYSPSGAIKTSTPEGGRPLMFEYNLQGKRIKLIDPDAGTVRDEYNGFGAMTLEVRAVHHGSDSVRTVYSYTNDGRLSSINRNGELTTYTYQTDRPENVQTVTLTDKQNHILHRRTFTYDDMARITSCNEEIADRNFNLRSFLNRNQYDVLGRLQTETYPTGYTIKNIYDANSNLVEVKDASGTSIWKANNENARGQLTSVNQGTKETRMNFDDRGLPLSIQANGVEDMEYSFDNMGNLSYRMDHLTAQKEDFGYDEKNRLTNWTIYRNGSQVKSDSIEFDSSTGNILRKTDLGNFTFSYGGLRSDNTPIGAHALTGISGLPASFPQPDVQYPTAALAVTYTDFGKIASLSEKGKYYTLTYGVDDERYRTDYYAQGLTQGTPTLTRFYAGNYEEELSSDGNVRKILYLSGGAVLIRNKGIDSLLYAYTDYQGSVIALTDANGNVIRKYAYDPWGARRNASDWTQKDDCANLIINRGYTGHEHIDQFAIINMNGRVYDPLTAIFMSPDPFVQTPDNWLNFNRYCYCINNPFKYTDKNGYWFGFDDLVSAIVGFISGYVSYGLATGNWGTKALAAGGIGAVISWVGWNTMGAGAAAFNDTGLGGFGRAGSANTLSDGISAVFGENSTYYGFQIVGLTYTNTRSHSDELKEADKKGWGGVLEYGVYAASAMLSTTLKPSAYNKIPNQTITKLAKFGGIVLTDNISDNYDGEKLQLKRLHLGPIGYDFETSGIYSIFSKNLTLNQRFDMGFETFTGLNAINGDIYINYRTRKCRCEIKYWSELKQIKINTSIVGYFAERVLNLSDLYFELIYNKTTFQYWYDLHYNEDGTPK